VFFGSDSFAMSDPANPAFSIGHFKLQIADLQLTLAKSSLWAHLKALVCNGWLALRAFCALFFIVDKRGYRGWNVNGRSELLPLVATS
jgi:hypothetical protein